MPRAAAARVAPANTSKGPTASSGCKPAKPRMTTARSPTGPAWTVGPLASMTRVPHIRPKPPGGRVEGGSEPEALEERPDDRSGVDLECGVAGEGADGPTELAPRPGVASPEDDVELDTGSGWAPVGAQDDLAGDPGIGRFGVTAVLERPPLHRGRKAGAVQ